MEKGKAYKVWGVQKQEAFKMIVVMMMAWCCQCVEEEKVESYGKLIDEINKVHHTTFELPSGSTVVKGEESEVREEHWSPVMHHYKMVMNELLKDIREREKKGRFFVYAEFAPRMFDYTNSYHLTSDGKHEVASDGHRRFPYKRYIGNPINRDGQRQRYDKYAGAVLEDPPARKNEEPFFAPTCVLIVITARYEDCAKELEMSLEELYSAITWKTRILQLKKKYSCFTTSLFVRLNTYKKAVDPLQFTPFSDLLFPQPQLYSTEFYALNEAIIKKAGFLSAYHFDVMIAN